VSRVVLVLATDAELSAGGADLRVAALQSALGRRYEVSVVRLVAPSGWRRELGRLSAMSRGVPPRFGGHWTERHADQVETAASDAAAVVLCTLFSVPLLRSWNRPVILDAHNVESDVMRQMVRTTDSASRRAGYLLTHRWSVSYEADVARRCDRVWAVSASDAAWFSSRGARTTIVPNGATLHRDTAALTTTPNVVFVGSLTSAFNREGIEWFLNAVWQQVRSDVPGVQLHLIGRGSEGYDGDDVVAHGFVDDLQHAYAAARVCIVPLLSGGGTRLKILEAMAAGIPVVATTVGAEGLDGLQEERDYFRADTAEAFARALTRLLTDDDLAERTRIQATSAVAAYSWPVALAPALDDLARLLSSTTHDR
jgi:glycosyltransferase involved in cell wall biosynthesis